MLPGQLTEISRITKIIQTEIDINKAKYKYEKIIINYITSSLNLKAKFIN